MLEKTQDIIYTNKYTKHRTNTISMLFSSTFGVVRFSLSTLDTTCVGCPAVNQMDFKCLLIAYAAISVVTCLTSNVRLASSSKTHCCYDFRFYASVS